MSAITPRNRAFAIKAFSIFVVGWLVGGIALVVTLDVMRNDVPRRLADSSIFADRSFWTTMAAVVVPVLASLVVVCVMAARETRRARRETTSDAI
jgi:uncharacterized membrane protein